MYENLSNAAAKSATIEKPRLSQQIEQLQKVLSGMSDTVASVDAAASRILGPVPESVDKAGTAVPPSDTIERRLAEAIGYAESLAGRLRNSAQRLNTAV